MRVSDAGELRPRDWILLSAILLISALVYLPSLTFPFAADDASQILGNPRVHSWEYVPQYFKTHVWGHLSLGTGERGAAYYRPLFLLWELVGWNLFGANPVGWHFSALTLHIGATALVYFVARRVIQDPLGACAAALVFGVHPIHIEGVTWISGATEPLGAIPFLGSFLCWLRAYDSPRPAAWRAGAVALYGMALLSKETTIILPLILVSYELLLRRREGLVRRVLPFGAVALIYLAVRQIVLTGMAHTPIPLSVLLFTWPSVLWFYVTHALIPFRLSLLYDLALVNRFSWSETGIPLLLVLATGAVVIWYTRANRAARFAAIFAVLAILPPLYLRAFSPVEIVHDRYLYLPSIGLCLLFGIALRQWPIRIGLPVTGVLTVVLGTLTIAESLPWSNETALFSHALQVAPHSWHARRQLAFALQRSQRCDDAMPLLAQILDASPDDYVAAFALGSCHFHKGQTDEAARMMHRVIALHPTFQQPYLLLAAILVRQGRIAEADEEWRQSRAVQLGDQPEPTFHLVRAEILRARGDLQGAIAEYRKELEVQPANEEIVASLSQAEAAAAGQR
jgi:Flp pilus assembly protein TadD